MSVIIIINKKKANNPIINHDSDKWLVGLLGQGSRPFQNVTCYSLNILNKK